MRSRKGLGNTPIKIAIATSGVRTTHSRPESAIAVMASRSSGCLMGPKKTRWYIQSM